MRLLFNTIKLSIKRLPCKATVTIARNVTEYDNSGLINLNVGDEIEVRAVENMMCTGKNLTTNQEGSFQLDSIKFL